MGGLVQRVALRALRPMGNVRLRSCFGQRLCGRRGARVWRFRCPWSAAVGWAASMARPGPALRASVGAMAGLSVPVSTPPAERWRCGLGRRRGRGSGGRRWRRPRGWAEAMSWRPPAWRVGTLAGWRVRSSPGCADAARFGLEHGNRQPAPFSAVRAVRAVRLASIPATRLRKAAASSQAWGLAAGMASAWRAAASCRVLSAGLSRP